MKSILEWLFPSKDWLEEANANHDMVVLPGWVIVFLILSFICGMIVIVGKMQ